jgi:protein-tyrosine-phosphatase
MAEGILKKRLQEQGAQLVTVQSAGTSAMAGLPASFIGVSVARKHSVDIIRHRSQPLTKKLLERSDLVLVMAQNHLQYIQEKFPQSAHKTHLLKNYGCSEPVAEADVVDPIGADGETYEAVYDDINNEINRITPFIIDNMMEKYF